MTSDRAKRVVVRRHRVEVEFHHVDMMRIVHNVQYLKWFEKGRFSIVNALFEDDDSARYRFLVPVVMNHCVYLTPARLGDPLVITTRHPVVERWAGRFRFEHSISHERTKLELASGESEVTVVEASTFRPVRDLPETIWNCYKKIQ